MIYLAIGEQDVNQCLNDCHATKKKNYSIRRNIMKLNFRLRLKNPSVEKFPETMDN
jgi:hypothetical protein